jgi:diguanylate cyclase (GGDEF)-like protein
MRFWLPLTVPLALLAGMAVALRVCPDAGAWPEAPLFRAMPYGALGLVALMGAWLAQSRVTLTALLAGAVTFFLHYTIAIRPDPARAQMAVLGASVVLPCLTLVLTRLSERGLVTRPGLARLMGVFAAFVVIVAVIGLGRVDPRGARAGSACLDGSSDVLRIPPAGLAAAALCLPGFLVRKAHESRILPPLMGVSVLFMLAGLNYGSAWWGGGRGLPALLLFMTGAAAALAWTVLESVWRHATTDDLTELPGRRMLKLHLAGLGSAYAIAVLDIDRFKRFNDRYGHTAGDEVLRYVAAHLRACRAGRAYRYGGEEFVIVNDRGMPEFRDQMEALRRAIAERVFTIRGKGRPRRKPEVPLAVGGPRERVQVTVSIGVAWRCERYPTARDVLDAADAALYRAKNAGRNRVSAARKPA